MTLSTLALLDGLGGPEVLVIAVVVLLLFGSKRMPEIGRGIGRAIREFKRATSSVEENIREVLYEEPNRPKIRPPAQRRAYGSPAPEASTTPNPPVPPPSSSAAAPRADADLNEPAPPETPDFAAEAERPDEPPRRGDSSPERA